MTDKQQHTYQYHFVVCVDVVVDEDGKVVAAATPFIEDVVPVDSKRMIYSEYEHKNDPIGDGWVGESPADRDEDGNYTGTGWHAATEAVKCRLFAHPAPTCTSCKDPIVDGSVHVGGADPFCPSCWHEDCSYYGVDCAQCGAWLCADCERISDGEKHTDPSGQTICSDCVVQ